MPQRISYELVLPVDDIKVEWHSSKTIMLNDLACDVEGNKITGYTLREIKLPVATITHNSESITFSELNERWIKFARSRPFPFQTSILRFEDNNLMFSGDAYGKNQLDYIFEYIVEFLRIQFYVVFDLNSF